MNGPELIFILLLLFLLNVIHTDLKDLNETINARLEKIEKILEER